MALRRWSLIFIALALMGTVLWLADIYRDRQYRLVVLASAPLYAQSPLDAPSSNKVLGALGPGQGVKVLRMRHGKDFRTFKVETGTGIRGWVIEGQGVRAIGKPPASEIKSKP